MPRYENQQGRNYNRQGRSPGQDTRDRQNANRSRHDGGQYSDMYSHSSDSRTRQSNSRQPSGRQPSGRGGGSNYPQDRNGGRGSRQPKKSMLETVVNKYVVVGLQAITTILLGVMLFRLDMLPAKVFIIVLAALALLLLLFFIVIDDRRKKKAVNWTFKGLSLLLSVLFIFISVYGFMGTSVLGNVSGTKIQTHSFSAVVLKDSPLESIADLSGKNVGVASSVNPEFLSQAVGDLEKKAGGSFTRADYESYIVLADALYSGEIDAMILDEAYRGQCEFSHVAFESETRVLEVKNIEEKIEVSTTAVEVDKEPFIMYISGIDTYGVVSSVSRSDVNMIVTVNPKTRKILMTSIPRDYYVTLPSFGAKDKLTHSGTYGVNETILTIENLFNIDINYYARVNFTSVINIVDALGGIDVYSDLGFMPYTNNDIYINEGMNHMDGAMALAFARERYAYIEGDNHRVQNQQEVLKGILDKVLSPSIITNFSGFLSSVDGSFETSMESSEISSLVKMQINDMSSWDIEQIQVSGYNDSSSSCYSAPGQSLYVMAPDESTVTAATKRITEVLNES